MRSAFGSKSGSLNSVALRNSPRISISNSAPSAIISVSFGLVMMLLASGLMALMRKLNRHIEIDPTTAIGNTARVYVRLPAKGEGLGQIQVSVSGRLKTVAAASNGQKIAAFADVKVVEARDDGTLIVEPLE